MKLNNFVKTGVALSGMVLASVLTVGGASAQQPLTLAQISEDFSAERTYQQSCSACHNSGAAGAPVFGNSEDWSARAEKGTETLYENTINGYNNIMPPKGMCFTCSDDELKAVVDYILAESVE
ncbi:MAG: c-type cytochrome [Pseudohongiella sp.]|uniref:cytochrome c5 family protein n=1 Tax=Pseudohongiella sp. TaxID=1979412 RepID=UPI0034A04A54